MRFSLLATLLIVLITSTSSVSAQNSKAMQKALNKEYKAKMKEYSKNGWKIFGSSRSLDVVLLKHYDALNNDESQELVGVVSNCKSANVCRQAALNNACTYYASLAGSNLKGRIVSDMAANQTAGEDSQEFDKLYAAYERLVETEIKGELKESYTVIRPNKDGSNEMQTFFIINQSEATKARIRAWENAQKESEAAQKYANQVSDFIKEGFETK